MNKAHIVLAHTGSTGFMSKVVSTADSALAEKGWNITTTRLTQWVAAQADTDGIRQAPDADTELLRVVDCDLLVLAFPIVWASVPATLKQWIEAVFSDQSGHEPLAKSSRWSMRGKKAIVVAASEYPERMQRYDRIETAMSETLSPLLEGTLNYLGFSVLRPFLIDTMEWVQAGEASGLLSEVDTAFSQIEHRVCFYGLRQPEPGPSHSLRI
jgi:putative NADPH-quinone reductase